MWMRKKASRHSLAYRGAHEQCTLVDLLLVLPRGMDLSYVLVDRLAHLATSIGVVASMFLVYVVRLEMCFFNFQLLTSTSSIAAQAVADQQDFHMAATRVHDGTYSTRHATM